MVVFSHRAMSLIEELYESNVRRNCFAYNSHKNSCLVCAELLCDKAGKKCPFFKTETKLKHDRKKSAEKLLAKMKDDETLRRKLKTLEITEDELRNWSS